MTDNKVPSRMCKEIEYRLQETLRDIYWRVQGVSVSTCSDHCQQHVDEIQSQIMGIIEGYLDNEVAE